MALTMTDSENRKIFYFSFSEDKIMVYLFNGEWGHIQDSYFMSLKSVSVVCIAETTVKD